MAEFSQSFQTGLSKTALSALLGDKVAASDDGKPIETIICEAGTMKVPVRITYNCKKDGATETKVVDPYEIKQYGEGRVLFGYCHEKGKTESYTIGRILSAKKMLTTEWKGPYPYIGPKMQSAVTPETLGYLEGGGI
jgi:predicted DNA-binding transcriptional regulator YafY